MADRTQHGAVRAGLLSRVVALGLTATTIGRSLFDNQDLLARISGVVLLAMGLYLFGSLLAVYSLGLGIPFLAAGLAFRRLAGTFDWVKKHLRVLTVASAGSLVVFGVLLATGQLLWITTQLQRALTAVGLEELVFLG